MIISIRNLEEKDKIAIENICLSTASKALQKSRASREFTLQMYNRYYVRQAKDHSFVAVNAQDEAVGYILCAPDFQEYFREFTKHECKEIFKKNILKGFYAYGSCLVEQLFAKRYPAHMHIDILKEYQNMGLGTRLVQTLKEHLQLTGCKGVHLCVAKTNVEAIRFYKKQKFKVLKDIGTAYYMGYEIF